MLQVSSDAKCYALSVPYYKNRGISRLTNKNFLSIFAQGLPAIFLAGLPAMFLAGMKALRAIRLRGGGAAAVAFRTTCLWGNWLKST
jgi:hypothetical protein